MAIYRRDQPEYNAAVANGAKNIKLTGGGGLAGGQTWDGRQLNAPAPAGGSATPRLDAGVATPRLDKNPARSTADAVANSNRNGAFGTGPQQLQARKDLFNQMAAAKPQDRAKFQGQAAALGVKRGGWDAAMGRLNMTEPAKPSPSPTVTPPAAPTGSDLANKNIRNKGIQGATADYYARKSSEKVAEFVKTGMPQARPTLSGNPWSVAAPSKSGGRPTWADLSKTPAKPSPLYSGTGAPKSQKTPAAPPSIASAATVSPPAPGSMLTPAPPLPSWEQVTGTKPRRANPAAKPMPSTQVAR